MRNVDSALSEISDIRAQLLATTRFVGISPGFNLMLGVINLVVMLTHYLFQPAIMGSEFAFVTFWGALLLASMVIIMGDAITRARRFHGAVAGVLVRTVMQKIMPFVAATIIVSWVFFSFAPESLRLLPGLWQILLGLMGFALLSNVPKELVLVASWYFGCGVVVLAVAGQHGLAPWMMGVPYAVGHFLVAYAFGRASGGIGVYKQI